MEEFKQNAGSLLRFCNEAEKALSAAHVSRAYDGAVIRLYADFERMILGALTGAINNDTSQLSATTSIQFPKHLNDAVCQYIIVGNGYFNFRGRDGLIREIKKYVPQSHYLVQAVKDVRYKTSIDQLCALRNYAAHGSMASKQIALRSVGQTRMGSAGSWLKRQDRFEQLVIRLWELSEDIEGGTEY